MSYAPPYSFGASFPDDPPGLEISLLLPKKASLA